MHNAETPVGSNQCARPLRLFTRYAASFTMTPLAPGTYYEGPQEVDVFGQECNCNTVVYRYAADPHVWSDEALIVQLVYGVYWLPECRNPAMVDLEAVLSNPIHL